MCAFTFPVKSNWRNLWESPKFHQFHQSLLQNKNFKALIVQVIITSKLLITNHFILITASDSMALLSKWDNYQILQPQTAPLTKGLGSLEDSDGKASPRKSTAAAGSKKAHVHHIHESCTHLLKKLNCYITFSFQVKAIAVVSISNRHFLPIRCKSLCTATETGKGTWGGKRTTLQVLNRENRSPGIQGNSRCWAGTRSPLQVHNQGNPLLTSSETVRSRGRVFHRGYQCPSSTTGGNTNMYTVPGLKEKGVERNQNTPFLKEFKNTHF